jgi:hypothetical protein
MHDADELIFRGDLVRLRSFHFVLRFVISQAYEDRPSTALQSQSRLSMGLDRLRNLDNDPACPK